MRFGDRIRELRKRKELGQRALAELVGVSFTYVSKIENHHLDFGEYPSEALIHKLAEALEVEEDELLLLAGRIPDRIRRKVMEHPEAFRRLAELEEDDFDWLMSRLDHLPTKSKTRKQTVKS